VINTSPGIARGFSTSFGLFLSQTIRFYETFDETAGILMIVIPIAYMLVFAFGMPIVTLRFLAELDGFVELLHSVDESAKAQAREPILKTLPPSHASLGAQRTVTSDKGFAIVFSLAIFIVDALIAGMASLLVYRARLVAHTYLVFQQWRYHSGIRGGEAYLACLYTYNAVFSSVVPSEFTDAHSSREVVVSLSTQLDEHASELRLQDERHEPVAGYDDTLDYWVLGKGCPEIENPLTHHDMYNCSGSTQLLRVLVSLAMTVLDNLEQWNGTLREAEPINMLHLIIDHLDPVLEGMNARIDSLSSAQRSLFSGEMVGIYVAALVCIFISFGIAYAFISDLGMVHRVLISLLERLPPVAVTSTASLRDYILGKQRLSTQTGMSTAQGIVHNSRDGIIVASRQGTIDYLNPAVSDILGYSPEDFLGQPLSRLFDDSQRDEMEAQMKLLRDRQLGSEMFERTVPCRTNDEGRFVLCHLTVIALYGTEHDLTDFVFIVKDVSEDHERELESQKAKERSENLLFAIIPRSIVARMKAGTDPTFVVPIASVMFIDIVKFSEFSRNLTPEQIMGTLASIFGSFDARLARWGLVTKIKLIGDVYMCASGLFDDAKPPAAAEEIVLYALECLQCLDDQNMKMDIALSVRIGINTGGPIIAGVLGNENRVFDIIGDAINVAARLQSTSRPNTIQMSVSTQEYVAGRGFGLERRDNVALKGKEGAVSTYLLTNEGSRSFTSGA
jgi:PAS domain S-box-containing protein